MPPIRSRAERIRTNRLRSQSLGFESGLLTYSAKVGEKLISHLGQFLKR